MTCLYDFNVWVDLTLVTYFDALTCHCIAVGLGMNYVVDLTVQYYLPTLFVGIVLCWSPGKSSCFF